MNEGIKVEIENGRIYIASSPYEKDRCKSIPGSRWDKDARQWHVPLSWAACKQLRAVFRDRLEIGPGLLTWAKEELDTRILPSLALREALTISDGGGLPHGLYDFQQAGALFLLTARKALLADPLGSGKTIQVIAAAQAVNALPMLVVCPNSMKLTWKREIEKWWPGIPVYVVGGTAAQRQKTFVLAAENSSVVVSNWESVRLHSRLAPYGNIALTDKERQPKQLNQIPFKLIVVDEAHRMKDPTSKQTRAVWSCGQNPSVIYRWALTGTPITNTPETLYPVLHFLDPNEWPSKTAFVNRYCMADFNIWGGLEVYGLKPDTQQEFFEIFDPQFRRMPKEIILPQLPKIVNEIRHIEMTPKQKRAYESMVENLCAETEDGMVVARNPIAQMTRLTQYASAYIEETEDGLKLSNPSCKLDTFMEDLADISEPIVVFAESRQLIRMAGKRLEDVGIPYSIIEGGQTVDSRQNAIDSFQNGKTDIILVVIKAGGVGLTLNRARIAIFLQRSWSLVDYQQATGRVHRIGSEIHDNVLIIDYVTRNTVEEAQLEVLAGKEIHLETIVRDREATIRLMRGQRNA